MNILFAGLVRWLPVLFGLGILLMSGPSLISGQRDPALGGFRSRAIALELAEDARQLKQVVDAYPKAQIAHDLLLDSTLIIPFYSGMFIVLGFALIRAPEHITHWVGWIIVMCAIAAALFDLLENYRSLAAISEQSQTVADSIRWAALIKWSLLMAILLLLAVALIRLGGWAAIPGGLCALAALVGIAGLVKSYQLIETFALLMGLALISVGWAITKRLK